jgi:hypothetical protein
MNLSQIMIITGLPLWFCSHFTQDVDGLLEKNKEKTEKQTDSCSGNPGKGMAFYLLKSSSIQ